MSSFKSAIKNYNSNKAILDKQFFNKNDKKYKDYKEKEIVKLL